MNCKPGDLAVIVVARVPAYALNIGKIVKVIRPYVDGEVLRGHRVPYDFGGGFCWVVESESGPLLVNPAARRFHHLHVCYDSSLRPIRDPGEDARDETLSWLPVPSKTKETA